MELTAENYYSKDANKAFMSVSQFKDFAGTYGKMACEFEAVEKMEERWKTEPTTALLVGSYVDSYFEGSLDEFKKKNPDIFTQKGELKASYKKAEEIIARIERDEYFMKFLSGEKQRIMTGNLFGCDWKIKMDSYIDSDNNLVGILSTDNNIPLYTLSEVEVNGTKYTDFTHKSAAQILDDINGMFAYQAKITKGVEKADTLMLPHSVYIDISTRQIPNTGYTVLRFLKENAPYLKDIVSAPELESDAEDTNPYNKGVMFLFTNSADKMSLEIPMSFYQYPLQNRNLEVIVPCEERVAGLIIYYPLSALIAVGV